MKGALLRRGRLLLLHRRDDLDLSPGLWDLPGGRVENERDSTLEAALIREFFEETGFTIRVGRVLDVSLQWPEVRGEAPFPCVLSCFYCETRSSGKPRLDSSEHSEFAWVTRSGLSGLATDPYLRPAMEKALLRRA